MADLPERIVVDKNGHYWRDYGDGYSMCPVSEDNEPVEVTATYVLAGTRNVEYSRGWDNAQAYFTGRPVGEIKWQRDAEGNWSIKTGQDGG